jgi:hypothetical protein
MIVILWDFSEDFSATQIDDSPVNEWDFDPFFRINPG